MKSRQWPVGAVFFFLLDTSVINSYICMREVSPSVKNKDAKLILSEQLKEFCLASRCVDRRPIIGKCLEQLPPRRCTTKVPLSEVPVLSDEQLSKCRYDLSLGHFIRRCTTRRVCVAHDREKGGRKQQNSCRYFCNVCGTFLHWECFEMFHRN